jgi:hypothetical protein
VASRQTLVRVLQRAAQQALEKVLVSPLVQHQQKEPVPLRQRVLVLPEKVLALLPVLLPVLPPQKELLQL